MTSGNIWTLFALATLVFVMGCGSDDDDTKTAKLPRPVSVFRLAESDPSRVDRLTGSVGSWKTEDLGFEVSGRVRYVIEPETDVDGEIYGVIEGSERAHASRDPITQGQVLAKLDDARYRLAVKSVQAQIETAVQHKKVTSIEIASVNPAQRAAADADLKFRKGEVDRNRQLVQSGAVARAEFDKNLADYDAAVAKLAQVDANKLAKQAEEASLQARIDELNESLAQAERDVADCELRSPFRGQVAKVQVIPGGVVQAGQSVVTVQMMDPIKVDLEVSAATSRRLNYRDIVNVIIPESEEDAAGPPATTVREEAFIYTIDPVADSATRTFTVTLLLRNQKVQSSPPADFLGPVVRTRDIWEFHKADFIKKDAHFVEAGSIHADGDDYYVWKITNRQQVVEKKTAVLNVAKVKVIPGEMHVDWLGLWTFREVTVAPGEPFDLDHDFIAGELDTADPLPGDKILLDRQKWRLRPGDLVEVDLRGGQAALGFFVPMDAINSGGGKNYVFEVADGRAKQLEVHISDGPNTLKRIVAAGDQQLTAGMQLVAGGVHYLLDGEAVNVVKEVQVQK